MKWNKGTAFIAILFDVIYGNSRVTVAIWQILAVSYQGSAILYVRGIQTRYIKRFTVKTNNETFNYKSQIKSVFQIVNYIFLYSVKNLVHMYSRVTYV